MNQNPSIPEDDKVFLKRYLSQYYNAKRRQVILWDRLNHIQAELRNPGLRPQIMDGTPADHGSIGNESASLAFRLAEIEDRINRQVELEAAAVIEVMDILEFLPPDSTEKEIMELRYIDCMTWSQIEQKTNYSRAQCYRYRKKGLVRLYGYKRVRQCIADYRVKVERMEKDAY